LRFSKSSLSILNIYTLIIIPLACETLGVFDDKEIVERDRANYFTEIYNRLSHMVATAKHIDFEEEDDAAAFTREEVAEVVKSCNLKKGKGPDCYDGHYCLAMNN
jgi:hypothetical protein